MKKIFCLILCLLMTVQMLIPVAATETDPTE